MWIGTVVGHLCVGAGVGRCHRLLSGLHVGVLGAAGGLWRATIRR